LRGLPGHLRGGKGRRQPNLVLEPNITANQYIREHGAAIRVSGSQGKKREEVDVLTRKRHGAVA